MIVCLKVAEKLIKEPSAKLYLALERMLHAVYSESKRRYSEMLISMIWIGFKISEGILKEMFVTRDEPLGVIIHDAEFKEIVKCG